MPLSTVCPLRSHRACRYPQANRETAVLLMPHMGRRKFSMGGKLHGRNMLISEYIFTLCVELLGSKEIFRIDNSNDSIEQMGRKQVSSHMQVVKKFFEDLRCCK